MPQSINAAWGDEQASRLEQVHHQLAQLVADHKLARTVAPAGAGEEWSITQLLGHLVEMVPYWLNSCRTIIAAAEPPIFGRSLDAPERLAGVEQGGMASPERLLAQLETEIRSAAAMIRALTEAERGKQGRHIQRGVMTVAEIIETMVVTHAEAHLAQARDVLAQR
jgi:hypothetical protein